MEQQKEQSVLTGSAQTAISASLPSAADEARTIAFGIPSLDDLLGQPATADEGADRSVRGYGLKGDESTTFCLIGPDGTGKSIFALHLVAEYWLRTSRAEVRPKILYASTDLSFARANTVWESFWLQRPHTRRRRTPFVPGWTAPTVVADEEEKHESDRTHKRQLVLDNFKPIDEAQKFAEFLNGDLASGKGTIAFLDLESTTAGDDWNLLNTILAELETPKPGAPRHLLVIDAVEGLETLVGDRDAFGEKQERRTRIAHVVRAAAAKCHLVFVVEESRDGERLPEVFVSDVVIRLRTTLDRDYARRTVECEKVRGQPHVRGQHDFRIRKRPSYTGAADTDLNVNPDEPYVGFAKAVLGPDAQLMSYIQVFPSLHLLSRAESGVPAMLSRAGSETSVTQAERRRDVDAEWRYAGFGIHQLDSMLAHARSADATADAEPPEAGHDRMGLPAGTVTTLMGNEATYKSQLARSFLSQCFRTRVDPINVASDPSARRAWREVFANAMDPIAGQGVAVLLTTIDTDRECLGRQLLDHLIKSPDMSELAKEVAGRKPKQDRLSAAAGCTVEHVRKWFDRLTVAAKTGEEWANADGGTKGDRVIVRRLETHHMPSTVLMHIVQRLIEEAKRRLRAALGQSVEPTAGKEHAEWRRKYAWRIRFVIDDWATLMSTYPEVRRDPLFVRTLMSYLRREGVTTLILATVHGNPNQITGEDAERDQDIRELRVYADNHLYTWHVPFYGERRVAITALPGLSSGQENLVRELRRATFAEVHRGRGVAPIVGVQLLPEADEEELLHSEVLVVDPHFELYKGLEEGRAEPVSLQVRLYAEMEGIKAFDKYLGEIKHLFGHMFGHNDRQTVLQPEYGLSYDTLRELTYLQSEARLDHTLVIQADEFWAESRSELRRQERYINARTVDRNGTRVRTEDPFSLFQLNEAGRQKHTDKGPLRRRDFYDVPGYDYHACSKKYPIHKVPYSWDFGFLLCNKRAWARAAGEQRDWTQDPWRTDGQNKQSVDDIWRRLWKILPPDGKPGTLPQAGYTPRAGGEGAKSTYDARSEGADDGVTWREFFGACKTVAVCMPEQGPAFDVDLLAVETFSCLVLEVWLSEWYRAERFEQRKGLLRGLGAAELAAFLADPDTSDPDMFRHRREYSLARSIRDRLAGRDNNPFRAALYRTMLMLGEVMGPAQLRHSNNEVAPRPANAGAVASRHWYSTAAAATTSPGDRPTLVPVGLPGHATVRGDWFLGVARGSRSARLGERAMDILCSRRSNIARLQTGLGLPVRDLFPAARDSDDAIAAAARENRNEYRTALQLVAGPEASTPVMYPELRALGAYDPRDGLGRRQHFFWLWRSMLQAYDLHARIWQKWLCSLVHHWPVWERQRGYADGFAEYDAWVKRFKSASSGKLKSQENPRWERFQTLCDNLIKTLDRACPAAEPPSPAKLAGRPTDK